MLQLVVLPNILLAFGNDQLASISGNECEIDLDDDFITSFTTCLLQNDIELKFFEGDWASADLNNEPYDLILSSEGIYNLASLPHLTRLLKATTRKESTCLVACKRIYFGCDGGEAEFRDEVRKQGGKVDEVGTKQVKGVDRAVLQVSFG